MAKQLFAAAAANQPDVIETLLQNHPELNVNQQNLEFENYTPLLVSAWHGFDRVVKVLLAQKGINVNQLDKRGYTPLLIACANAHTIVVKMLLGFPGVDYVTSTSYQKNAMYLASAHGRTQFCRLLLRSTDLGVNDPDNEGYTPLWKAAYYGKVEPIKWMIARGKPLDLAVKPGPQTGHANMNSIDAARSNDALQVVTLLEQFLKDPAQCRKAIREELGIQALALYERDFGISFGNFEKEGDATLEPLAIQHLNLSMVDMPSISDNLGMSFLSSIAQPV